jgi:hypothetical protein
MANDKKGFWSIARDLSRNPLGIIALFICLIYGFACLVTGLTGNLKETERLPLIWFLTLFPAVVLSVFYWLVSKHHWKLYSPEEMGPDRFVSAAIPGMSKLQIEAEQQSPENEGDDKVVTKAKSEEPAEVVEDRKPLEAKEDESDEEEEEPEMDEDDISVETSSLDLTTPEGRAIERQRLYETKRYLFLSHMAVPSKRKGQKYDIFVYLVNHKKKGFDEVVKAEFFFGKSWGNKIFQATRIGDLIGVRISAYGTFLCTCHVTFTDQSKVTLYHYIDFTIGEVLNQIF